MSQVLLLIITSLLIGLGVGYRIGSRSQVSHLEQEITSTDGNDGEIEKSNIRSKSSRRPASLDSHLTEEQQVLIEMVNDSSCEKYFEQKTEEKWQADLAEAKELVQRSSSYEELIQEQIQKDLDTLHLDLGNSSDE